MNINLSYNVLEEKLQNIKCSLNNLCVILDQYRDVSDNRGIDTISFADSLSSYHTALETLSFSSSVSYFSAIDQLEFEELSIANTFDQCKTESRNTITKKTVSFSKSVTILEVYNLKNKKRFCKRDRIINFKGKFIDYIYREKFYIKYKWQKFKHSIFKSSKSENSQDQNKQEISEESCKIISTFEEANEIKTIDLKSFFQEIFENSIIETDLDQNSVAVVRNNYKVPLTDLTTVVACKKSSACQSPIEEIKCNEKSRTDQIRRESIKIQPKLYTHCDPIQKSNSIENNILLKYLISKAQYPIQLKIATSIVKLNLPLWYQSSLIV